MVGRCLIHLAGCHYTMEGVVGRRGAGLGDDIGWIGVYIHDGREA